MRLAVSPSAGEVSAILDRPQAARWLYVFGHGAGAGMRHAFMQATVRELNAVDMATLRYQFPYVERRSSRPDPQPVLLATVRAAVEAARQAAGDLPLLAGGKSMGGRMTSLAAAAEGGLPEVRGLVFFGFPLHAPGSPGTARAEHLERVPAPMLFLQGTRDTFADLSLLRPVLEKLGARATLHVVEDADHGFDMLKRSGRTTADVIAELARTARTWADGL